MPFSTALNSTQLDYLRNDAGSVPAYSSDQYLLLGANTTVLSAQVNQSTFADSFVQVTYDGATGDYTAVEAGMVVLISHTSDPRRAFFTGRVRAAPTSTVLYINETSAGVADNDYLWVIQDYRLMPKLGRVSGASYYKDYNITYHAPNPLIYGLQSAYAGICDPDTDTISFTFSPSAIAVGSGATISSWLWAYPSGVSNAGNDTDQSVTLTFDAAASEYWVKVTVVDSASRSQTRRFPVWAVPADLSGAVYLGSEGASVEGDADNGWNATVKAFDGVDNVLDNTLAVVLEVERFGTTETSILSNIRFAGRLRTERGQTSADEQYGVVSEVEYQLEGIGAQLSRIIAPFIYMREKASPTVWDELATLTFWRGMWYLLFHSTFHELHSLSFDSTANTYRTPYLKSITGNLLQALLDLAESITAGLEFAPTGEVNVARKAVYLTDTARDALPTIADFTDADWIEFTLQHEHVDTHGAVGGAGGSYNTTSGGVLVLMGNAPKVAQGDADGNATLAGQVLDANLTKDAAKTELATRLGHHLRAVNPTDELSVTFPDAYKFLVPSNNRWYTFTISADENTAGRAYTTDDRWLLRSVSISHDNETGTDTVQGIFRLETAGTPGTAYEPPAPNEIPAYVPQIPQLPPFTSLDPPPVWLPPEIVEDEVPPPVGVSEVVPTNGNAVFMATATGAYTTQSFLGIVRYNDVTPALHDGGTIRAGQLGFGKEAYLLESDGADSWVWYTENVFAAAPVWTSGATVDGVYNRLRLASSPGAVYIQSPGGGTWSKTFDFTVDAQGFTVITDLGYNNGTYSAGVGWTTTDNLNTTVTPNNADRSIFIKRQFASATITRVEITYNLTKGTYNDNSLRGIFIDINNVGILEDIESLAFSAMSTGDGQTLEWTGSQSGVSQLNISLRSSQDNSSPYNYFGAALITQIVVEGTGASPFGASGQTSTAYSDDYGATLATPQNVGDSPGSFSGLDTDKIGVAVLTGADEQVKIATSAGGSYTDYGDPMPTGAQPSCILLPRRQFGGTTSNAGTSTPQYLVASDTLTASDEAVWKVTASGVTFTDITPQVGDDYGYAVSANCLAMMWFNGNKIAAVLQFGSLPRLMTSTNAGTGWTNRGVMTAQANYIRFRKGDSNGVQLFLADGQPVYSPDFGASLVYKAHPSSLGKTDDPLLFIEPYG